MKSLDIIMKLPKLGWMHEIRSKKIKEKTSPEPSDFAKAEENAEADRMVSSSEF